MTNLTRRTLLGAAAGAGALAAAGSHAHANPVGRGRPGDHDETLLTWARDTWKSLVAMTDPNTGLVADNIDGDLTNRSGYTSPTNIGGLLWSTIVARDLRIINPGEARNIIARTLRTLQGMERHDASGMYFNWYDEATGDVLRVWPEDGNPVVPFVSSVDMGWLGAALYVVAQADPSNRKAALQLFNAMRWDIFYDKDFRAPAGANYGGFWIENPERPGTALLPPTIGEGPDLWYHVQHHYDTAISEARMVTYLGIFREQIPPIAYFGTYRTFPPDWTWQEMIPVGEWREYLGFPVYEGAYTYRGFRVVPGWGGSMFEELMPDIFVPEATWGPRSWGRNHPLHVRAQREHGLDDAQYGYWGFSPSSNPAGGYREYGVDALGMNPEGYFSDQERTDYHADNPPTTYGDGVVTPHAAFLGMMYEPEEATTNLRNLQADFDSYGPGGFYDAVAVRSGQVARRHLSLDQSMIMGALGNVLLNGGLRRWFATAEVEAQLRPLLALEEFNAGE
ncbi:glucoamylase family protein [Tessaracoccus oleiagri]|uniref:Uncharacterized protein n=1 Tax=Tessaracoccus oleiagri TaxID=686624 RepID=A0A1G9HND2_9ACTN|nr:glucoamylase family protein [Tessaracoccus oleiagri]SDL14013.1 Protein of unknown function [Tessaracoccus oleiagri]